MHSNSLTLSTSMTYDSLSVNTLSSCMTLWMFGLSVLMISGSHGTFSINCGSYDMVVSVLKGFGNHPNGFVCLHCSVCVCVHVYIYIYIYICGLTFFWGGEIEKGNS
jgi:hypothetical protein